MKITRNTDLVFHRSVLRVPLDAIRHSMGLPVREAKRRTLAESLRVVERRRQPPPPEPATLDLHLPESNWDSIDGVPGRTSEQLASDIADLAARRATEAVAELAAAVPPVPPIPTILIEPFDGDASHADSPPRSQTSDRSKGSLGGRSRASLSEGDHSQEGSADTVLRTELSDVLGSNTAIFIRKGGQRRLLSSVSEAQRDALKGVIEQAAQSRDITMLSDASATSDGLASFPVTVQGGSFTAFLYYDLEGRVTQVEVSDEALENLFEARDEGRLRVAARFGDTAPPPAPRPATPPPLTPRQGMAARVDVSGRLQRSAGISDGTPGHTYTYDPRPERDHGLLVEATAQGELRLAAIRARPGLSAALGSGTDMILGLACRLNADGYRVREITGSLMPEPGIDSQHRRFTQSLSSGRPAEEAAMDTFFGKVARTFGFTDVLVGQAGEGVYVRFRRPSP